MLHENVSLTASKLSFSKDGEIGLNIFHMRKLELREAKLLLRAIRIVSDLDEL